VAQAYFRLQGDTARLELAGAALALREQEFGLARSRLKRGLEDSRAEANAAAELEQARQTLAGLEQRIRLERTALAQLTGQGPDAALEISAAGLPQEEAFPLPADLALELLGRRPDVEALRWRVEAAAQEIGAARARFYPNLNLIALIGLQATGLSHLLSAASAIASIGPALELPLFDGGQRAAGLNARYAEYDLAVAQYNQAVLDATRDAVDRLSELQTLQLQSGQQEKVLAATQELQRSAESRHRHGLADYGPVLQSGRRLIAAREAGVALAEQRRQAALALIRALGGGYRKPAS
jgi:NodT family efflux transporter outer membrane factor (OMF) lipoprotein